MHNLWFIHFFKLCVLFVLSLKVPRSLQHVEFRGWIFNWIMWLWIPQNMDHITRLKAHTEQSLTAITIHNNTAESCCSISHIHNIDSTYIFQFSTPPITLHSFFSVGRMECFLRWWKFMVRRVGERRVRMNILIATGHDIINNNKSWGRLLSSSQHTANSKRWKLFAFSFSWENLWWGGWKFNSFQHEKKNGDLWWFLGMETLTSLKLSFRVSNQHKFWPLVGHMFELAVTRKNQHWEAAKYHIEFSLKRRWKWTRQAKRNTRKLLKEKFFSFFSFHAYALLVQRQDCDWNEKKMEVSEQIKNIESWWMLDVVSACCEKLSSKLLSRIAKLSHLDSVQRRIFSNFPLEFNLKLFDELISFTRISRVCSHGRKWYFMEFKNKLLKKFAKAFVMQLIDWHQHVSVMSYYIIPQILRSIFRLQIICVILYYTILTVLRNRWNWFKKNRIQQKPTTRC